MRSFFWSLFSAFGLNTEVFSPNARKYGLEKTPYLDTSRSVTKAEVHLEPSQRSKIERSGKIVNKFNWSAVFAKISILNV